MTSTGPRHPMWRGSSAALIVDAALEASGAPGLNVTKAAREEKSQHGTAGNVLCWFGEPPAH